MYWKRRPTRLKPKDRIPELDAARGFCILGMAAVHLIYDLTELYPILRREYPPVFLLLKNWGGIAFFLISGISATLGRRHLRRGLLVLACGWLVSAVTRFAGAMPIRFGVLHCLGISMLLWQFFYSRSIRELCAFGALFAALGYVVADFAVSNPYLYPLGLVVPGFESADYFPLLPNFGFFLLGTALGKRCYSTRRSRFPHLPPLRFLRFCGRHSLSIYLFHQPLLLFCIEALIRLSQEARS